MQKWETYSTEAMGVFQDTDTRRCSISSLVSPLSSEDRTNRFHDWHPPSTVLSKSFHSCMWWNSHPYGVESFGFSFADCKLGGFQYLPSGTIWRVFDLKFIQIHSLNLTHSDIIVAFLLKYLSLINTSFPWLALGAGLEPARNPFYKMQLANN